MGPFVVRVRSGIVDGILFVIIDFIIIFFIGKLLGVLGLLLDLQRLRSTRKMRLREIEFPVAGHVRHTLGGCFTVVMIMVLFLALLVAENGINGTSVKTVKDFKFDELRYLAIDQFKGSFINANPQLLSFVDAGGCQYLQGLFKVQFAEFRGPVADNGGTERLCSDLSNAPIKTLQLSRRTDYLRFYYSCKYKAADFVGNLKVIDGKRTDKMEDVTAIEFEVQNCNADLRFSELHVKSNVSEGKMWFFKYSDLERSATSILITYRNSSDPENFYRIATGQRYNEEDIFLSGFAKTRVYQVTEEYFGSVGETDILNYSQNTMQTDCADGPCLLKKIRKGLSKFSVATWLYWIRRYEDLGTTLDISFHNRYGRILMRDKLSDGKRGRGLRVVSSSDGLGSEAATEVSAYSVIILAILVGAALLSAVTSRIAGRKPWRWHGIDVTSFERNRLLQKIYDDVTMENDGNCMEDAKDLIVVITDDGSCKAVKRSIEEKEESKLRKTESSDHGV